MKDGKSLYELSEHELMKEADRYREMAIAVIDSSRLFFFSPSL
jgi:hypothetical protein